MIPQRITDYLRERRIRALAEQMKTAQRAGRSGEARAVLLRFTAEINARSPAQVARMERALFGRAL